MRTKLSGVREIIKGQRYEINYMIGCRRFQYRINATSLSEAYSKRLEEMADKRKNASSLLGSEERFNAGFSDAWEKLHADLIADNLPQKTIHHYVRTYKRMFNDFRALKFPQVKSFKQLNLPFFREYRNYYVSDLGRPNGLRAELVYVKAIMRRLYTLGYCTKELIEILREIKKPKAIKKEYISTSNSKIRELFQTIKRERPDYYYPLYFISRTGRRISETTLIEKKDVEWQGFKPMRLNIRAETTKTKQNSPLRKLDQDLEQHISEAYKKSIKHKQPYLFLNRLGRKCRPGRVRVYLKQVSRAIIGRAITPHYFRHRFLTECGKVNVPLVDVMAICGIKDVDVLVKYYSHSTEEGQAKVLEVSGNW
ncbi:tyrosine-type recombinase/integrase [Candidatus Omnitrophota bacterium]